MAMGAHRRRRGAAMTQPFLRRLRALDASLHRHDATSEDQRAGWQSLSKRVPGASSSAAAAVESLNQPVLDLASLRVTQIRLRNDAQMTDLIEHIANGGSWTTEIDGDLPKVVRFEDGQLFLRDGHHRCVASLAAGRTRLMPSEYELEDWEYCAWAEPNFKTGFITPYDPRHAIRVHDLTEHRKAVAAVLAQSGEEAAAEYIATHPEGYLALGGRAGRDTVSDLLGTWMQQSTKDTQTWVEDCVEWTEKWQKALAPSSADASARAHAHALSAPPEPHFPVGWRANNPLPSGMDMCATTLHTPGGLKDAVQRYDRVSLLSCYLQPTVATRALTKCRLMAAQEGYLVIRGLLSAKEVEAAKARLQGIVQCWPHDAPASVYNAERESPGVPLVDIDPAVLEGSMPTPRARELAVRRVFRLAVHDRFFKDLASEPKFTDLLARAWATEDIAVLQSMALLKPPGTGEKFFHADNAYFRLYPERVGAYWVALDAVDHTNGAMHVVPRSHRGGVPPHLPNVSARDVAAARRDAVAVPLSPGDALLFHGNILHGTPPNVSSRRRRALQIHYADANCRPSDRRTLLREDTRFSRVIEAPNPVFGPHPTNDDGSGFDCAPNQEGDVCYEPQLWHFRSAEAIARGHAQGGRCL